MYTELPCAPAGTSRNWGLTSSVRPIASIADNLQSKFQNHMQRCQDRVYDYGLVLNSPIVPIPQLLTSRSLTWPTVTLTTPVMSTTAVDKG